MKKEERYLVLKLEDINKALTNGEYNYRLYDALRTVLAEVGYQRYLQGKKEKRYVVVAEDWPEYDKVWEMIEQRVDAEEKAK